MCFKEFLAYKKYLAKDT